ncbi:MAG: nucleoside phosphorylase [Oscillospiraceae bacterium]|jgi:uridine phosphorylase|nr:nucleoside phosphorylase [Oscillospiraceae bacterium]
MSILDTFDPSPEAIIMPKLIRPARGAETPLPETVLVTFRKEITERLLQRFAPEVVGACALGRTVQLYRFVCESKPFGFYNTLVGGAPNAILLEQAIAMGGRRILVFGTCGALRPDLTSGHFILPTEAYRDEGVSYHYAPPGDWIRVPTAQRLGEIFDELGLPYTKGRTWTTDAFFRETPRNTQLRREQGCLAVEMECASLMAVAQLRGAEVYQFFYADDCLTGNTWDRRTMGAETQDTQERVLAAALAVALKLSAINP